MTLPVPGDAGEMLRAIENAAGHPLRAMIEIADRCNEVCVHCYQEQGLKGEMTTAQLEGVIDGLAELGVLVLTISGGEATLRSDFLHIMGHARKRGFVLRLFTNGLTMTRELAAALHALAVDVVEISLYSHRPEVHDFVTGVPRSFERTVAGIRHLVALGVSTHVKTPIMRVNEDELDAYMDFVEALGAHCSLDPQVLSPREYASLEPSAFDRSPQGAVRALRNERMGASRALAIVPASAERVCGAGDAIHVEPNGEVRPCVVLPMTLGSALDAAGARAAYHSEARKELSRLTWAHVRGCRDCDLRPYCQRCHAQSLAEVGDALAPYGSACETARQRYQFVTGQELVLERGSDTLGPFRLSAEHSARSFAAAATADDDALARRLGWSRGAPAVAQLPATPGALVQLRRPGRKRARPERVPQVLKEVADAAE